MTIAIRVAREIHIPISAALSLSMSELMLWREVFAEEYYQIHPEKRPQKEQSEDENIAIIKAMLTSRNNKVIQNG